MKKFDKLVAFIKPYLIMVLMFSFSVFFLKIAESLFLLHDCGELIKVFHKTFFLFLSSCCFFSLLIFPIYLILRLINKNISIIITSMVFVIILFLEIGLSIYTKETKLLLGSELIERPLRETIGIIGTEINIYLLVVVFIILMISFIYLIYIIDKKTKSKKSISLIIFGLIIVFACFIFTINKAQNSIDSMDKRNYSTVKIIHFINEIIENKFININNEIVFDNERVMEFLNEYPEWQVNDIKYPLERLDDTNNVLGDFFLKSDTAPNVVIIMCESLSRTINSPQLDGISFTPFLDSISSQSLYWTNCVSTSPRTFNVLPAITGSLPLGVKGFQFGKMPEHNTLFSVLKENNYQTNVFHAEIPYFDHKSNFFLAQEVDFYPDFYAEYEKNKTEYNGLEYWGYHDSIMLAKTIQELNALHTNKKLFNLIITISTHERLNADNPLFKRAYTKTIEIYQKLNNNNTITKDKKEIYNKNKSLAASFVYLDLSLQTFFEQYSKRDDYNNTIFIITGDHSSGFKKENELMQYHVPLIIYSPLLTTHAQFPAVVSHNDIVPTLVKLLESNYKIKKTNSVSWVGTNLDTSSFFGSQTKQMFLSYANGPECFLYNDLFLYHDHLYKYDECFSLKELNDVDLLKKIKDKFELYKYIHRYVYVNNKLTAHPISIVKKYQTIKKIKTKGEFIVTFSDTVHFQQYNLVEEKIDGKYSEIKVTIDADVNFIYPEQETNDMGFSTICKGTNINNDRYDMDKIMRYIDSENVASNKWHTIHFSSSYNVSEASDITVSSYFFLNKGNRMVKSVWKNVIFTIEGI
jgi:phosphoglycerol transferase MdoB-like AlkP superfamily enzyme